MYVAKCRIQSSIRWGVLSTLTNIDWRNRKFHFTVHGGWNAWGPWSTCGKTCGGAVRERTRFCTNPPPYHGGRGCGTHYYESKECAINKCPGEE